MLFMTARGTPPRGQVDEALIARVASGEDEALAELYDRTRTAVYGYALSIVKNPHDAQDVMQDTYLKMCAGAPAYRPMGKPMAWVLAISRNLALMKLRERKREIAAGWPDDTAARPGVTAEDRLVLDASLRLLGDEERQIVSLHALAGFKHREIAAFMEMPLSTVLSKYQRALKKLRAELQKGWDA